MAFEVCWPKLKHFKKIVTVVDSHLSVWIIILLNWPFYPINWSKNTSVFGYHNGKPWNGGSGKNQLTIFFVGGGGWGGGGGGGNSASLAGGHKERWKIGSFIPDRKRSHVWVLYLPYVFGQTGLSKQWDPNEIAQNVVSRQGLYCLLLIQQFLDTTFGNI